MLYQFMPRLSDDEYAALESSIREHGIRIPILVDENGSVIDGHHRKEIASRLDVECPTIHEVGLSDVQKRTLALSLNIDRRHLNREQKRELVEASIKADPELSDRGHAKRTGTTHPTVAAIRREVESFTTSTSSAVESLPEVAPSAPVEAVTAPVEKHTPDAVTINPATGEVIDTPVVTEHTITEKTRTVVGLDGKNYTTPAGPKERRSSIIDNARSAGWQLRKAVERVDRIRQDDRFTRNKAEIVAALQPHLDLALEILADL